MGRPQAVRAGHANVDGSRRTEILQTAASLIATSGLRTSLQEIADAAGILPGSLYHHFESKEAILVELLRRYHADLERIAAQALERLDETARVGLRPDHRSRLRGRPMRRRAPGSALQMSFYESPSPNPELTELTRRPPTATHGRDAADVARGEMGRLSALRRRSPAARRPGLPDHAPRWAWMSCATTPQPTRSRS